MSSACGLVLQILRKPVRYGPIPSSGISSHCAMTGGELRRRSSSVAAGSYRNLGFLVGEDPLCFGKDPLEDFVVKRGEACDSLGANFCTAFLIRSRLNGRFRADLRSRFQSHKHGQLLVSAHRETHSFVAVRVNNPDRLPSQPIAVTQPNSIRLC